MTESAFVQDLAMLMAAAGLVSVVFGKLRWPKVIGYILAGALMSPHSWGGAFLRDIGSTRIIGQLGIVLLMFSMGLGFSARSLRRIRAVAIPAALLDTAVMIWLGYMLGTRVFGWPVVPSLFLGAAICDSATTMLAKVIGEMKWGERPFVKLALGTSVCEDIVCVGVIALVTGVANGCGMDVGAAVRSLGGLLVFFLSVIVLGFVLLPRLLVSVAKMKDDEALLLTVLGSLFFVSYIAYRFDFSLALGAFLVGVLAAASDVHHRVYELVAPLKNMFAAVFFVSIGLLVDPVACVRCWPAVLAVTLIVFVGKFFNNALAALLTGERLSTAVQMGMSLAQIGEFAFMVALLYVSLSGDYQSPMYQIVIAASVLTTLANPVLIRLSERLGAAAEQRLPARLAAWHETYRALVERYREGSGTSAVRRQVSRSLVSLAVLFALFLALAIVCRMLPDYDYSRFSVVFERYDRLIFYVLANLLAIPFLPLIIRSARTLGEGGAAAVIGEGGANWQEALRHGVRNCLVIFILVLFYLEVVMADVALLPPEKWMQWAVLLLVVVVGAVGWRFFRRVGMRAVTRFTESLDAEERREKLAQLVEVRLPEGVHALHLAASSPAVGGTVVTLDIRAKTGASVLAVRRRGETIRNPGPALEFLADDELIVSGDGAQLAALKDLLGIIAQTAETAAEKQEGNRS